MANEVTMTVSAAYDDSVSIASLSKANLQRTSSGLKVLKNIQEIGLVEEAVDVGDAGSAGGYTIMLVNLDDTNYVQFYNGTGGTPTIRLSPLGTLGDVAIFRQDAGDTLYGIADTAACDVEVLVISA